MFGPEADSDNWNEELQEQGRAMMLNVGCRIAIDMRTDLMSYTIKDITSTDWVIWRSYLTHRTM